MLRRESWRICRARDQEVSLLRAALAERDMRLRDSKSELLGAPPRSGRHATPPAPSTSLQAGAGLMDHRVCSVE